MRAIISLCSAIGLIATEVIVVPYHDGVWPGPLAVLVDNETWSAAEEFAALLQDNHAAVIVGTRTGGAGCGHTWGGTPTVLENSGAAFKARLIQKHLPDALALAADSARLGR
jgi:hypothetical protein